MKHEIWNLIGSREPRGNDPLPNTHTHTQFIYLLTHPVPWGKAHVNREGPCNSASLSIDFLL
ncbi:hypothetical protein CaCOL14_005518 [Colletotrichum acutatum]